MASTEPGSSGPPKSPGNARAVSERALQDFAAFWKAVAESAERFSALAERDASTFLLGLGSGLLALSFALRVRWYGTSVLSIEAVDFGILVVVACALLTAGAFLRVYRARVEHEATKQIREVGRDTWLRALCLLEKELETARKQVTDGQSAQSRRGGV